MYVMKYFLLTLLTFSQLLAGDMIELYHCYGNDRTLLVAGRILDPREIPEVKRNDSFLTNLWRKLGYIFNDERKNVPVTLRVRERTFETRTDDEGYFAFEVTFPPGILKTYEKVTLFLPRKPEVTTSCKAWIPTSQKQIGIISDFDDTLIISDVTYKLKLAYQLLLKNYKQREAVAGMAERFREILAKSPDKPLFIITGSPKQFNIVIQKFLNYRHFPKRTLITKQIHGDRSWSPFRQHDYKTEHIERLIALYPQIRWVLFGDSGEQDRKIYMKLAKKHPDKIEAIYIRDVKSGKIEKVYPAKTTPSPL